MAQKGTEEGGGGLRGGGRKSDRRGAEIGQKSNRSGAEELTAFYWAANTTCIETSSVQINITDYRSILVQSWDSSENTYSPLRVQEDSVSDRSQGFFGIPHRTAGGSGSGVRERGWRRRGRPTGWENVRGRAVMRGQFAA